MLFVQQLQPKSTLSINCTQTRSNALVPAEGSDSRGVQELIRWFRTDGFIVPARAVTMTILFSRSRLTMPT